MTSKRIKQHFYSGERIVHKQGKLVVERLPEDCLYADAIWATKLKKEDLPESFVHVYVRRLHGWLDANGVKDLRYYPNYFTNHWLKDDFLYVSYNSPIVVDEEYYARYREDIPNIDSEGQFPIVCKGYDYIVTASFIIDFCKKCAEYGYDKGKIDKILERIDAKTQWYEEQKKKEQEKFNL